MLRDDGQVHVSSFCTGGQCVGVSVDGEDVVLTAVPDGPTVQCGREEWAAFVAGVKNGEFDLP